MLIFFKISFDKVQLFTAAIINCVYNQISGELFKFCETSIECEIFMNYVFQTL